jgi:hypothetical protein
VKRLAILISTALALAAPALALAQPRVCLVTDVVGTATVTRNTLPQPVPLTRLNHIFEGDHIVTADGAVLQLACGGFHGALATREPSALRVGSQAGGPAMTLDAGKIFYSVSVGLLRPGEVHEIRTRNTTADVRGGTVTVEVEPRPEPMPAVTHVCALGGVVWAGAVGGGAAVKIGPNQCVTVAGNVLGPVRAVPPVGSQVPQRTGTMAPRIPAKWTLLTDRGHGFGPWVGTPLEGYVAAEVIYANVGLAACEAAVRTLAEPRARMACVRSPYPGSITYKSGDAGHMMAKGPFAGRMVVYDVAATAADWKLMDLSRDGRTVTAVYRENLKLAACDDFAMRSTHFYTVACVRSPRDLEYRDDRGHLMAAGPFAGGMIVYDPLER